MPYSHDALIYQQDTVMVGFWQCGKCKAEFTVLSSFYRLESVSCSLLTPLMIKLSNYWRNSSI
jgi:hypothetical protein